MKFFREKKGVLKIALITSLLLGLSCGTVFANTIKSFELVNPEEGWTRIDDTDKSIEFDKGGDGSWHVWDEPAPKYFNGTSHRCSTNSHTIEFNFTGDKLRIIGETQFWSAEYRVIIDGVEERHYNTQKDDHSYLHQVLLEKKGLEYKEHSARIVFYRVGGGYTNTFDAIDIDKNGVLKPYNTDIKPSEILNIEPEKTKIKVNQTVTANVVINNIKEIAAEDIRIKFDNTKLKFEGFEEADGVKLVKSIEPTANGELRVILASKGESNIVNAKKVLLKLKFKGIQKGDALVDVTKGRVSDGIEMEKDLTALECGEATITIEGINDVNNSGEYTLLDLGIDARHLGKDPKTLPQYNTDLDNNSAIDDLDLSEIGKLMLENPNYQPNNN